MQRAGVVFPYGACANDNKYFTPGRGGVEPQHAPQEMYVPPGIKMEMQAQVQHQGQRGRAAAVRAGGRREGAGASFLFGRRK